MKKMEGFVSASSPYALYEDQTRSKHISVRDYEDLLLENEVKRKKVQMVKEERLTLLAEIRFLRRRHQFLILRQSKKARPLMNSQAEKKNTKRKSKSVLPHPVPSFDSKKKEDIQIERLVSLQNPSSSKQHASKQVTLLDSKPNLDLNKSGKEVVLVRNVAPVFDLNQILMEEEEVQVVNCEPLQTKEGIRSPIRAGIDEQYSDISLSGCRNISNNGTSKSGKRKISWQDQLALRV